MNGEDLEQRTLAYLQAAAREWQYLEAGGAPIPLTGVFTLLEAVRRPEPRPLEPRPDLAPLPERLEHVGASPPPPGPLPLSRPTGEGEGVARRAGGGGEAPVSLSHALREARRLVLLGEPGAGKTTTLQYIALWFAARAAAAQAKGPPLQADLEIDEPCVPVRLDLRTLADKLPASGALLEEALAREVDCFLRKGLETARELVRAWRDAGRLLPLLDGLDEVPEDRREEVRREIARFATSPDGSRCRMVVASRIAGYAPLGSDFKEYTLIPFQEEEARRYLAGWLAALRPKWGKEEAGRRADGLLDQMRGTALRRLTDNPLLLRMAAELYADRGEIARSRAELYRRWVEGEAWRRACKRGAREEQKENALERLEEVAWALQNGLPEPELSEEEERLLRERMGLLVRLGDCRAFAHRTFQEYFAARRLARAWRENRAGAWSFLRPRLHLPDWREPLLLLAGELDPPNAADLIRRVARAHRSLGEDARYERYLRRDLLLALHLVGEARERPPEAFRRILDRASRLLGRSDIPSALKRALAEALGEIGDPRAIPALVGALKDENERVRRAAAVALGRIGAPAVPALIGALKDADREVRRAAAEALGRIGDREAVPALIGALKDADWEVRGAAAEALVRIGAPAVPALVGALKDENGWVRGAAAEALGRVGDPRAVPALVGALEDAEEWVRRAAAGALGRIGDREAVPALVGALEDADWWVREAAAEALGRIGDREAVPALTEALKDAYERVRRAAAWALGEIGDREAVPALVGALKDADREVRRAAAGALGRIGDREAVPALLGALKDENERVRWAAAGALGEIGDREAVPALVGALKDADAEVRRAAAGALGRIGDREAVPALVGALKDADGEVRRAAAGALGRIGDREAVPALVGALKDADERVRWAAAGALGRIGDREAVPALIGALKDADWGVRWAAAVALREIGDREAVPALVGALKDENERVRWAAAGALGRIGDPQAVPALIGALKDADWEVRGAAAGALGRIGNREAVPALVGALKDENERVRWAAAGALGRIGDPQAVPALVGALEDADLWVRLAAAWALGRVGDPRAVPALVGALKDENKWVRRAAAGALGRIGDREAVPALVGALKDADWEVRLAAAEALGEILGGLRPAAGKRERREQAALLRRAARALYRARRRAEVYFPLRVVLEKWEALTLCYRDPFAAPPLLRVARRVGPALAVGLLLAALALLGVLSGAAGDLLKEQAEALLRAYPLPALAGLLALLAALTGALSWALDRLRKR